MNIEVLSAHGMDYPQGLARCMNQPELYASILSMFLEDDSFRRAETAYAMRDYAEMFNALHELKGVSGNMAMTELYAAVRPLVEEVRNGQADDGVVDGMFAAVRTAYDRTCKGITLGLEK